MAGDAARSKGSGIYYRGFAGLFAARFEVEVIDYNLEKCREWTIVSREIQIKDGMCVRHVVGLDVYGPKRYYSLSITPEHCEDDVSCRRHESSARIPSGPPTGFGGYLQGSGRKIFHEMLPWR